MKFQVLKDEFKALISAHSKTIAKFAPTGHVLTGMQFVVKDNTLIMASTDGNRLLKSEMTIIDSQGDGHAIYSGFALSKIKILKNYLCNVVGYVDVLKLELLEDSLKITDLANNICWNIPAINGEFPKYEQLIPKVSEEYTKIAFNKNFVEELSKLVTNRANIVEFAFKNNSPLTPMIATSNNGDLKTTCLLMPVEQR